MTTPTGHTRDQLLKREGDPRAGNSEGNGEAGEAIAEDGGDEGGPGDVDAEGHHLSSAVTRRGTHHVAPNRSLEAPADRIHDRDADDDHEQPADGRVEEPALYAFVHPSPLGHSSSLDPRGCGQSLRHEVRGRGR